jgi:hypothetical protein
VSWTGTSAFEGAAGGAELEPQRDALGACDGDTLGAAESDSLGLSRGRFKQEGLAEEMVEFLGEAMQCELVAHLKEAALYRAAHRTVKRYDLQAQFPEVRVRVLRLRPSASCPCWSLPEERPYPHPSRILILHKVDAAPT